MGRRSTLTMAAAASCVVLLAACSGGSTRIGSPNPKPATAVQGAGSSPSGRAIDPNFDQGQVVLITPSGFRPHWLVALDNTTIEFRNESGVPQSVVFDHQAIRSGTIAPGGVFRFTPHNVMSMTYRSGLDSAARGVIQVNEVLGSPAP
jgi:hypothetical protein